MGQREVAALTKKLYGEGLKGKKLADKLPRAKTIIEALKDPAASVTIDVDDLLERITDINDEGDGLVDNEKANEAYRELKAALISSGQPAAAVDVMLEQNPLPADSTLKPGINDTDLRALRKAAGLSETDEYFTDEDANTGFAQAQENLRKLVEQATAFMTPENIQATPVDAIPIQARLEYFITESSDVKELLQQNPTSATETDMEDVERMTQQISTLFDQFKAAVTPGATPDTGAGTGLESELADQADEPEPQPETEIGEGGTPDTLPSGHNATGHNAVAAISALLSQQQQMTQANSGQLKASIDALTKVVKDTQALKELSQKGIAQQIPNYASMTKEQQTQAKREAEASLQRDPLIQRMLDANVITLKDIIKGDTIPLLEDSATRAKVIDRLNTLEQQAEQRARPLMAERAQRQTKAFTRTLPEKGNLKLYVPPRYAPAGTPGAKRQRPATAAAMIGFPTGAYYT